MIVLENLNLEEIKTKAMVGVLNNFNVEKALVVLSEDNQNVILSARNIPNIKTVRADMLNVYDILKYETFVATKDAVAKIEEVYA